MSKPEFFVTPGYGERQLRTFHYSQAVKIGNRVETSGQGGWNDNWEFPESLTDEIAQTKRRSPAHWENYSRWSDSGERPKHASFSEPRAHFCMKPKKVRSART